MNGTTAVNAADEQRSEQLTLSAPWRVEGILRELYVERELSQPEIGDRLGCSGKTISRWMKRHGIAARSQQQASCLAVGTPYARLTTDGGHPIWRDHHDAGETGQTIVYVHQLLAIAEGGDPYEIFREETDIHHKNGIPWDNRPANITVMSHKEHTRHHHAQQDAPWNDPETLKREYETATIGELADRWDTYYTTVRRSLMRFGIERREQWERPPSRTVSGEQEGAL